MTGDAGKVLTLAGLAFSAALVVARMPGGGVAADEGGAAVKWVVDGDTIHLTDGRKVRYIGIDAPETAHAPKGAQCFGEAATLVHKELLKTGMVWLSYDKEKKDKYGRVLAYVHTDAQRRVMVNERLVALGAARARTWPPNVKHRKRLAKAQAAAKKAGLGLWQFCTGAPAK